MLCIFLLILALFFSYKLLYRALGHTYFLANLQNKAVLISGCDSGFGYHSAIYLSSKFGATVFAGCLTSAAVRELSDIAASKRLKLHPLHLDITDPSAIQQTMTTIEKSGKPLQALINNAAICYAIYPDDWANVDDYRRHFEVNVFGTIALTQAVKPLVKLARGRIVFTTSIRGRIALPEAGPYTASKWALEGYADTLRRELDVFGVSVHVIQPGGFLANPNAIPNFVENLKRRWRELKTEVKGEYGAVFYENRLRRTENWHTTQVTGLEPVLDAYAEAAFSRFPRYRYVPGNDALFTYLPVSFLPEFWQDVLLCRLGGELSKPAAEKNN